MSVDSSREAFLQALERLLSKPAAEPGVNAVAREAGLSKVLLYRYFGSWEGFLEEFARRINPWRDLRLQAETGFAEHRWTEPGPFLKWLFRGYLERLDSDPLLRSLLARATVDRDPLQSALEADREREGLALAALVGTQFAVPPEALNMVSLLTAGLTWVTLMGMKTGAFNGLSFAPGSGASTYLAAASDSWVDALTDQAARTTL